MQVVEYLNITLYLLILTHLVILIVKLCLYTVGRYLIWCGKIAILENFAAVAFKPNNNVVISTGNDLLYHLLPFGPPCITAYLFRFEIFKQHLRLPTAKEKIYDSPRRDSSSRCEVLFSDRIESYIRMQVASQSLQRQVISKLSRYIPIRSLGLEMCQIHLTNYTN